MSQKTLKLQELGRRLVDREVVYCVSSLIDTLTKVAQFVPTGLRDEVDIDAEALYALSYRIDFDEAAEAHINDCEYIDDLISMAEHLDCLEQAQLAAGYDENNPPVETPADPDDPDSEDELCASFEDFFYMMKAADEEGPILDAVRKVIIENLPANHDEFCQEFDIDTDDYQSEVYEYWIVTKWLAQKLAERGEVTGEVCGLTVWGRTCTGQAISMDYVIQQIAAELWPEELKGDDDDAARVLD